jgi:hypothetical protein
MNETIANSSALLTPIVTNNRKIECVNEKSSNKFLKEDNVNSAVHFQENHTSVSVKGKNIVLNNPAVNISNKLYSNRMSNNRKIYKKDCSTAGEGVNNPNKTDEKLLSLNTSSLLNTDAYVNNNSHLFNRSDTDSSNVSNLIKISIDTDQTDCETAHEENYSPKKNINQTKIAHPSPNFIKSYSLNAEDGLLVNENVSFTSSEFGKVIKEVEFHKETVRNKPNLKVQDLALKLPKLLERKMMNYPRLIISLSTFYTLPVVQLILLYQTQLNKSGNEDSCYFNFLCMIKNGPFAAFNNVFSNVGYVLLGIMFIIVVKKRSYSYTVMRKKYPIIMASHGIPQHFGLFYTMGIGLVMEGILSAAYHVCPSYNNFQFDTSFMYIIGVISTIKLYQTRHPDIHPSSQKARTLI